MTTDAPDLNLLMVHADDHAPVLAEGIAESTAQGQHVGGATDEAGHFWDEGGDPNDIELQRWGVIAPQGPEGDRLLALIRPLIEHRQAQQGDPVRVYRVPSQVEPGRGDALEEARVRQRGRAQHRGPSISADPRRPRSGVARIAAGPGQRRICRSPRLRQGGGLRRLCRQAAALGAGRRGVGKPDSLFFTVHDGTAATAVGHRALVAPGVEVVRRRQQSGQYPANEILEFGDQVTPSPDELLARAAQGDPSVLFTLSHGEGAPRGGWRSPEEQRRRQGAMSFGREGKITGEDLQSRPFLPGGVWFMLACYGAGTPDTSAYKHWLAALAAAGQFRGKPEAVLAGLPGPNDRPFTAALPQAVLANPNGPLAFMGHIDLAWTYSFQELDSGATNRPARYMGIMRSILKRDRVGVSMRELLRFFDQTNVELTSLHDQEARERSAGRPFQVDAARQGHLWMLRQDLAAYVLLGDPAARLPQAGLAGPAPSARPQEVSSRSVATTPAPPAATEAPPAPMPAPAPAPAPASAPASASGDSFAIPAPAASDSFAIPAASPPTPVAAPREVVDDATTAALEEAVAQCLLAELAIATAAARVGLSREALTQLVARYREIGRRALTGGK
jgi:hypothetical protein